jgi:hypothetical protein
MDILQQAIMRLREARLVNESLGSESPNLE